MPISDLLDQISGGKSNGAPAPALQRSNTLPTKRKADEPLRNDASKTPRWSTPQPKSSQLTRPSSDIRTLPQRPTGGSGSAPKATPSRPAMPASKPVNDNNRVSKPALSSRPAPAPSGASSAPRAPPKKGSFAEILARGKLAQSSMGQVGRIQHKKVEKGMTRRERDDITPVPRSKGRPAAGYSGTGKPAQRNGAKASAPSKGNRNGTAARPKPTSGRDPVDDEVQKKAKKAAAATTGYTGTARPKPGSSSRKKDAPRGGALLNIAPPRHSSSKHSRYEDEYDEELDDFIDYDDEEEGEPRGGYDSEGSSDMEAGLDDIDGEERRAEFIARREDIEEDRREKSLKLAKEDRKRKALEALRAGRSH